MYEMYWHNAFQMINFVMIICNVFETKFNQCTRTHLMCEQMINEQMMDIIHFFFKRIPINIYQNEQCSSQPFPDKWSIFYSKFELTVCTATLEQFAIHFRNIVLIFPY